MKRSAQIAKMEDTDDRCLDVPFSWGIGKVVGLDGGAGTAGTSFVSAVGSDEPGCVEPVVSPPCGVMVVAVVAVVVEP